jgi:hypothetical protein
MNFSQTNNNAGDVNNKIETGPVTLPMFPDDEVTRLSDNVFIHKPKYERCGYRVYLKVNNQTFRVNGDVYPNGDPELEHAQFTARMLQKAVDRLTGKEVVK